MTQENLVIETWNITEEGHVLVSTEPLLDRVAQTSTNTPDKVFFVIKRADEVDSSETPIHS